MTAERGKTLMARISLFLGADRRCSCLYIRYQTRVEGEAMTLLMAALPDPSCLMNIRIHLVAESHCNN